MEVASWSLANDVTNLTFFDEPGPESVARGDRGCAQTSVQSAATGMSYQEYELSPSIGCLRYTRTYPCCPDSPWTQLWVVVKLARPVTEKSPLNVTPSTIVQSTSRSNVPDVTGMQREQYANGGGNVASVTLNLVYGQLRSAP